jgi:ABC-type transport system substrate-binding protein
MAMSQVMQDQLSKMGLNIDFQVMDWGTMISRIAKRDPGLTVFSRILFYVSVFWTCGEVLALQCRRDSGMIRR